MSKLVRSELQTLIQQGEDVIQHGTCYTCEYFLGYLAQLRMNSEPANRDLFIPFKVDRMQTHKCIGCDPCPPADVYAEYMKKR